MERSAFGLPSLPRRASPWVSALALAGICIAHSARAAPEDVVGEWRTGAPGTMSVQVYVCDQGICGRIVRMPDSSIPDMHNPEPRLRTRPVLGIQILSGRRSGPEGWKGRIYLYDNGYSYPARLHNIDRNRLKVEICGPFGFFCTEEQWTRTR